MPAPSNPPLPDAAQDAPLNLGEPTIDELKRRLRERIAQADAPRGPWAGVPMPPKIATAPQILNARIPAPAWAVRGLLPQGLTILAGKPKAGKSWLALDIALAVAGAWPALGELQAQPGGVLYLSLEDTAYRIQARLRAALGPQPPPANFAAAIHWPRFPDGLNTLRVYLHDNPRTRLVIVDTLAKVRPIHPVNGNTYSDDYEAIGQIKSLADQKQVAILVVHHLRKATVDDPLDAVSGSAGLTGAADTIHVLTRRRGAGAARLFVTGRDLDEEEYTLAWQSEPAGWRIAHDEEEIAPPAALETVFAAVQRAPDGVTPGELAAITGRSPNYIYVNLHRLAQLGRITKQSGRYHATEAAAGSGESGVESPPPTPSPYTQEQPHPLTILEVPS